LLPFIRPLSERERWEKPGIKGRKQDEDGGHKSLLAFLNWLSGPTHSAFAAVAAGVAAGQD